MDRVQYQIVLIVANLLRLVYFVQNVTQVYIYHLINYRV